MLKGISKAVVVVAVLLAAVSCGYDAATAFNSDGTVNVTLKFLFPTSLMQGSAGSGTAVTGLSQADADKATVELQKKYPGAKASLVTEGDETGAQIMIPFKTEKDAFAYLTQPSTLSPGGATTGGSTGINLSNTGGLFQSATHDTSGQTDTYTFKTQPMPLPSPSPGSQPTITGDELSSIFTITFALTVPKEITSAPGALFTLDRKTAIWKLSWTQAQTLTATTGGPGLSGLAANNASGQSWALLIGVALVTLGVGFIIGLLSPGRRGHPMAAVAGPAPSPEPAGFTPTPPDTSGAVQWAQPPSGGMQGPPPGMPPPTPPGS